MDGDELGVILSREQGETPGLYDIYVNVKEWNPNYELTNEPDGTDKFEVIEKIIVKPISCEKEYGDADPVYQIGDENGNPLSEETLSKLGTLTVVREDTSENAGTYELTVQAAEADGNFVLDLQEGKLTIQPRKIELEIDQKTKKKGAKDPELTYTAVRTGTEDTAVVEGDDLGLVLSREQGEKVGFYDIYLDVSGWNTNYKLTNAPDGTDKFEITAKKSGSNGGSHSGSSSGSTDVKATSPKTADTAHAEWYAGSMTLALVGIAAVLYYRRKRS